MEELYNDIMTMQPRYKTFGDTLFWTYATRQAIATAANSGEEAISKKFYMFRHIFYNKFKSGKQHISDLYRFNKLKMQYAGFCFYCYKDFPPESLTADHVFPRVKGGTNDMDNIIFVCKSCKRTRRLWRVENKKIRRVAPPNNSQRNNPYCDLLGFNIQVQN